MSGRPDTTNPPKTTLQIRYERTCRNESGEALILSVARSVLVPAQGRRLREHRDPLLCKFDDVPLVLKG